ncbi:hypothetical protein PVL29_025795 [Vitis rotundifolia]|uniref:Uncharacterized protein n=1 Tax=Vitis rotundifolia TaxID=103349 RepID=A0AA38YKX5_VITRO|nr:hypothetical protein PVL29_025795 [Vitis rotundifolia]
MKIGRFGSRVGITNYQRSTHTFSASRSPCTHRDKLSRLNPSGGVEKGATTTTKIRGKKDGGEKDDEGDGDGVAEAEVGKVGGGRSGGERKGGLGMGCKGWEGGGYEDGR